MEGPGYYPRPRSNTANRVEIGGYCSDPIHRHACFAIPRELPPVLPGRHIHPSAERLRLPARSLDQVRQRSPTPSPQHGHGLSENVRGWVAYDLHMAKRTVLEVSSAA
jgi:hypothetical protein